MAAETTYNMLSDPEMKEIVESFIIETKEILEKLDIDLVEIEKRPDDMELLNQIFRGFHTIKGTSGFLGLDKMTRVTHKCEDILNKLRKGEAALSSELMDGILSSYDLLKVILDSVEVNANEDIEVEGVVELLADLIQKLEIPSTVQITKPEKTAAKKKSTAKKTPGRKKKTKVESTEEVKIIEASAQVQNIESPGINESVPLEIEHEIQSGKTQDQKSVFTPTQAIERGAHFLVMGRSLTQSSNLEESLKLI